MSKRKHYPLLGFCTLAAALPLAVSAQESVLEEIVITATKRETSVQDTPLAVSAFSQQTLTENHVTNLLDLQGMVPSLHIAQNGDHATPLVYIRGIGSDNQTEAGDPGVAMHVDGIYSARSQAAAAMAFDLNRVEVLRGPQGTLFGRNSTGGVVNFITALPTEEFEARTAATLGSYNRQAVEGMVNMPVTDRWALRFAGAYDYADGTIDFAQGSASLSDDDKYNAYRVRGFRASSKFDISENLVWNANYEIFNDRGTGYQPATDYDAKLLLDTLGELDLETRSFRSRLDWEVNDNLTVSYIAGITDMDQTQDWDGDRAGGIGSETDPAVYHQTNQTVWSKHEATQHEIQIKNSDDSSIRWIVGLFDFQEENGIRFDMEHQDSTGSGWGGGPAHSFQQPNRGLDSQAIYGQITFDLTDALRLTAGARSGNDERFDKGGRNIACPNLIRSGRNGIIGVVAVNEASAAAGQCFVTNYNDVSQDWDSTTYMARVEYDLSADKMLYAMYAEGFKPGVIQDGGGVGGAVYSGPNDPAFLADLAAVIAVNNGNDPGSRAYVNPEENQSFELGAKFSLRDGTMTLNAALFHTKYDDLQVSGVVTTSTGQQVVRSSNAAKATINGLELELRQSVFDGAGLLTATYAYLDATYDKFLTNDSDFATNGQTWNPSANNPALPDLVDMSGNTLKQAPESQLMLAYTHDFNLQSGATVTPRLRMTYIDDLFFNEANRGNRPAMLVDNATGNLIPAANGAASNIDVQEAYAKWDVSLAYNSASGKWQAEGFVNNATDEVIRNDDNGVGAAEPDFYLAPPRTYGVRVNYNFQ
jgi:iron complex outermembrane receptor protein